MPTVEFKLNVKITWKRIDLIENEFNKKNKNIKNSLNLKIKELYLLSGACYK